MPRILSNAEIGELQTPAQVAANLETVDFAERAEKARKARNRRYRRLASGSSDVRCGDHTDNTPTLRKETKVRNRLELSENTYVLDGNRGKFSTLTRIEEDGTVDTVVTLAVLQMYRIIQASQRKPKGGCK